MIQGVCEQRAWDGRAGGGIDQVTTVSQTRLNGRTVRIDVADEFLTDADGLAIKAYLFSLPAVHATAPDNTFAFPFNQRWLMVFWLTLFNADARFAPNSGRSNKDRF